MKYSLLILFSLFLVAFVYSQERRRRCPKAWVFFDLGNTIVDTKTYKYKPMFYMRDISAQASDGSYLWKDGNNYKSAREYLNKLKEDSFILGMLIDIPERWGTQWPLNNPVKDVPTARILRT